MAHSDPRIPAHPLRALPMPILNQLADVLDRRSMLGRMGAEDLASALGFNAGDIWKFEETAGPCWTKALFRECDSRGITLDIIQTALESIDYPASHVIPSNLDRINEYIRRPRPVTELGRNDEDPRQHTDVSTSSSQCPRHECTCRTPSWDPENTVPKQYVTSSHFPAEYWSHSASASVEPRSHIARSPLYWNDPSGYPLQPESSHTNNNCRIPPPVEVQPSVPFLSQRSQPDSGGNQRLPVEMARVTLLPLPDSTTGGDVCPPHGDFFVSNPSSGEESCPDSPDPDVPGRPKCGRKRRRNKAGYREPFVFVTGGRCRDEMQSLITEELQDLESLGFHVVWDDARGDEAGEKWTYLFEKATCVIIGVTRHYVEAAKKSSGVENRASKINRRVQLELLDQCRENKRFYHVIFSRTRLDRRIPADLDVAAYMWPTDRNKLFEQLQKRFSLSNRP